MHGFYEKVQAIINPFRYSFFILLLFPVYTYHFKKI
jgi:hypothetical protein